MSGERSSAENPFSTCFVRPGAISFHFARGESANQLVNRFFVAGRRGALVGPHGAGKSTLLTLLLKELAARGVVVQDFVLHDGRRRLPRDVEFVPRSIVCIDGYEQLSYCSRLSVAWRLSRAQCGLLITTHRVVRFPVPIPVLAEVRPSVEIAVALVQSLLTEHGAAGSAGGISPAEIERIFFEVGSDMRELFFRLYDLYESRRR